MSKHQVGDIVVVTGNVSGHNYAIGQKIRITEVILDEGAYSSQPVVGEGFPWAVCDDEIQAQFET